MLSPDIPVVYADLSRTPSATGPRLYQPRLLAAARVTYISSKYGVDLAKNIVLALDPGDGPPDWAAAEALEMDMTQLGREPPASAAWASLPDPLGQPGNYKSWQKQFQTWLSRERPLTLWRCPALKELSRPDENEAAFRVRLQHLAREARDSQTDTLREKYAAKLAALTDRQRRAEQAVQREQEQSSGAKLDAVVSAGSAIFGALFGRRKISTTSMTRAATAMRKASNVRRQSGDVQRADETVATISAQIEELESRLQADISDMEGTMNAQASELEEVAIRPRAGDINIQFCGLAWLS